MGLYFSLLFDYATNFSRLFSTHQLCIFWDTAQSSMVGLSGTVLEICQKKLLFILYRDDLRNVLGPVDLTQESEADGLEHCLLMNGLALQVLFCDVYTLVDKLRLINISCPSSHNQTIWGFSTSPNLFRKGSLRGGYQVTERVLESCNLRDCVSLVNINSRLVIIYKFRLSLSLIKQSLNLH